MEDENKEIATEEVGAGEATTDGGEPTTSTESTADTTPVEPETGAGEPTPTNA